MEEQVAKRFFADSREKGEEILALPHIGEDVKQVIRNLLKAGENFRELVDNAAGQGADVRVAKRRLSEAGKKHEMDLTEMRKLILSIATEIEMVNVESGHIIKRRRAVTDDPDVDAAKRIQTSSKRIVDVVLALSKKNSEAIKDSQS